MEALAHARYAPLSRTQNFTDNREPCPTDADGPSIPGGFFDYPRPDTELTPGYFRASGWILGEQGPVDRLTLTIDGAPVSRSRLLTERHDLATAFAMPVAALGGFQDMLDLRDAGVGPVELSGWGETADGDRVELPTVKLNLRPPPPDPEPLAPLPVTDPSPAPTTAGRSQAPKVLVVAHDLGIGGAQLALTELLRRLTSDRNLTGTVLCPRGGALLPQVESYGFEVKISGEFDAGNPDTYNRQVGELADWAAAERFDLALVNSTAAYAGADLAARLGLPRIWVVHESFGLEGLFALDPEGTTDPAVHARAIRTLPEVAAAVFQSAATRSIYDDLLPDGIAHTIPYGIDLPAFDSRLNSISREQARLEIGAGPDEIVILCLGTIEPRKGQTSLVQAFSRVAEKWPKAKLYLVGSRQDEAEAGPLLAAELFGVAERVSVSPITPDVTNYLRSADLLVNASDIESLPRTVVEAMAAGVPVVATDTFGVPELIRHGKTGWLCETCDTASLTKGLRRGLRAGRWKRRRITRAARSLIEAEHGLDLASTRYSKLIDQVLAEHSRER